MSGQRPAVVRAFGPRGSGDRFTRLNVVKSDGELGEINERDKARFLGEAAALLFPVDWPEPFGLVMIEAMACGTPVIAFGCGSIPKVLEDGESGFIVDTLEEAVLAVRRIASLERTKVRSEFERRFTAERMAAHYLEIYDKLINAGAEPAEVGKVNGKLVPRPLVDTIVAERPDPSVLPARRGLGERSVP